MSPGGRLRHGPAGGHAHEREDDESRRGLSKKPFWTRPLHAKAVVTTQPGINKSQMAGQCCLGHIPYMGGINYSGNLVKHALVKWLVSSEVYYSKLYQLNVINTELLCAKCYVWGV